MIYLLPVKSHLSLTNDFNIVFSHSGEGEEPMTALDAERLAQGTKKPSCSKRSVCKRNLKFYFSVFLFYNFVRFFCFSFRSKPILKLKT